jgi:uncharacterized membrane protein (DUF2068 family)
VAKQTRSRGAARGAPEAAAPAELPAPLFALLGALCFEAADAALGLLTVGADRSAQAAVASVAAGRLALVVLATFGVWRRFRWGYWLAGVIAAAVLLLETTGVLVPSFARVEIAGQELAEAGFLSIALTLGKALAYAWFLVGAFRERRRPA